MNRFSKEQWEAARILIARLQSEANGDQFSYEALGVKWLSPSDDPCATNDAGEVLLTSDFLFALFALLWSLIHQQADAIGGTPNDVIAQLGLYLALADPTF